MKKIAFVLALFLIIGVVSSFAQDSYTVDLSKLQGMSGTKKPTEGANNKAVPFTRQYDVWGVLFKDLPADIDWTKFNKAKIRIQPYAKNGKALKDAYGQVIISVFYEGNENNWDAAPSVFYPGANVPLKADNIGAAGPAPASKDAGAAITLTKAPGGIIIQNGAPTVATFDVLEVTFFKE